MARSEFCTKNSSMNTERKTANAVGGKTARACDSCLRKRARWYCTADDAFLCQGCDSLVHSANQLASRHERVRLKTASSKQLSELKTLESDYAPSWQYGFTRKARTPRPPKQAQKNKERTRNAFPLVPEIGNDDMSMFDEETEAQLLYRVPVFDPFAAEFCNVSNETQNIIRDYKADDHLFPRSGADEACDLATFPVFLPSDHMELEEFAADVETLLGMRFDEGSCGIEGLGLTDCKQEIKIDGCYEENTVKVEDDQEVQAAIIACQFDSGLDMSRETLDWNFGYESPVTGEDELEEEKLVVPVETMEMMSEKSKVEKKKLLRLNYEEVILAWDNHGCPWTSGIRPEINPNDCWPDLLMGTSADDMARYPYVGGSNIDDGREARVTRYREKRRRRLFSKKIRYEVRKLNAEKRPRMKGRFVKRTSFAGESIYTIPT